MSQGTLIGLIRDINDRKENARVRDVLRQNPNFLTDEDPEATMQAVKTIYQINPEKGMAFADHVAKQRATRMQAGTANADRYRTGLLGVTSMLRATRDSGGDLGAAFDSLGPVFKRGFQMNDEEIGYWRQQVTANPNVIDSLEQGLLGPDDSKPILGTPGSVLWNRGGKTLARNPAAPKTIQMKRGDGGTDLYVMDETGNFIPAGGGAPNVPSAPGASAGGGYSGPKQVNPQARGVRNGNPGNIKDGPWARKQPGYTGSDGTFAKFQPGFGEAAQESLLGTHYVNGQRNVQQIVDKYLGFPGAKENSPESRNNYIGYVAGRLGIDPNQPVPANKVGPLAQAMREFENGGQVGASAAPRPVVSTPGKPVPQGWRKMSPDEVKALPGLDPAKTYLAKVDGADAGNIKPVAGQGTTNKAGKPAGSTLQAHYIGVSALQKLRDEARAIKKHPAFNQATGSIQGRLPSLTQGSADFDSKMEAYKGRVFVNTVQAVKAASPNGASGYGSITEKEGERITSSQGALDQVSPKNITETLSLHEKDAMVMIGLMFNIPPDATELLVQRPELRGQYDAKYGKGLSKKVLGY